RVEESASRFAGIGEKESKTFDRLMAILPRSSCANGAPHAKSTVCRSIGRAGGAYTRSGGGGACRRFADRRRPGQSRLFGAAAGAHDVLVRSAQRKRR